MQPAADPADGQAGRAVGIVREVLARARAIYLAEHSEEWSDLLPEVRPCVDAMLGEIERAARRPAQAVAAERPAGGS